MSEEINRILDELVDDFRWVLDIIMDYDYDYGFEDEKYKNAIKEVDRIYKKWFK